jgi:hypothetical protein
MKALFCKGLNPEVIALTVCYSWLPTPLGKVVIYHINICQLQMTTNGKT